MDKTILTASNVWTNLSEEVQSLISKQTFATWFEPIQAVGIDEKSLTLEVPSKFYYEWIDRHYRDLLLSKLKAATGKDLKVRYSVVVGEEADNGESVKEPKMFTDQ
ncbi:MAG: DnaA N-terminal domain-containing protein, partial [Candidatus Neomarinimicrobiota bacterium]|nr:DnaA N-terminal domain-containing protein [Candidatus Neomarinimicrobiota bacterium]